MYFEYTSLIVNAIAKKGDLTEEDYYFLWGETASALKDIYDYLVDKHFDYEFDSLDKKDNIIITKSEFINEIIDYSYTLKKNLSFSEFYDLMHNNI